MLFVGERCVTRVYSSVEYCGCILKRIVRFESSVRIGACKGRVKMKRVVWLLEDGAALMRCRLPCRKPRWLLLWRECGGGDRGLAGNKL